MTTTAPVVGTADQPDPEQPPRWRRSPLVAWLGLAVVLVAVAASLLVRPGDGDTGDDAVAGDDASAPEDETPVEVAAPSATVTGLDDGAVLDASGLADLLVTITGEGTTAGLVVHLDDQRLPGEPSDPVVLDGSSLGPLPDGAHRLTVTAADADTTDPIVELDFTLDTLDPVLSLPAVIEATALDGPLEVDVTLDGPAAVTAAGADVVQQDATAVTLSWATPPRTVVVTATDEAGNSTTVEAPVVVPFPGGRAVHVTPSAWRYEPKRTPVIELLEQGLIDAVQLDIKDELGDVSWDTDVELAELVGAEDFNRNFDVRAAIETIHSYDARVIGRLVVYRDTRLAQWAWNNGRQDMVLQATDGTPYAGRYGDYAFTNFANADVQQYNLDIALEAADVGFDDVLYDYIRRPDGAIDKLVVPGLGDRTPEDAVVEVMAQAYPLLRERGVWVGASVFGIAVDRPTQMAQHIPSMAPHVDYIAPMVYPNHWNLGEYDVPVPEDAPYDIVERSLTLYREALEGTGVALMPWLQDFGGYGEAEVRAQIDATEAVTGERSFMLWSSGATYTNEALDPIPGRGVTADAPTDTVGDADDAQDGAVATDTP